MPTKATYKRFETDPSLEFEFFLVEKLGLGTVGRLRTVMSQAEFMAWSIYFGRKAQRQELAHKMAR